MQLESNRKPEINLLNFEKLLPLGTRLEELLSVGKPVVLAIDGRAASGKTSLAERLAGKYQARVIHLDDFFLPRELRTQERLAEPGGNLHYERFIDEVLLALRTQGSFNYQAFNCDLMTLGNLRNLPSAQLSIVEGAYALHPKLGSYYNLSLFLSCPLEIQLARVKIRNPNKLEEFQTHWIPLEEVYFQAFGIAELVDFTIQT